MMTAAEARAKINSADAVQAKQLLAKIEEAIEKAVACWEGTATVASSRVILGVEPALIALGYQVQYLSNGREGNFYQISW